MGTKHTMSLGCKNYKIIRSVPVPQTDIELKIVCVRPYPNVMATISLPPTTGLPLKYLFKTIRYRVKFYQLQRNIVRLCCPQSFLHPLENQSDSDNPNIRKFLEAKSKGKGLRVTFAPDVLTKSMDQNGSSSPKLSCSHNTK